MTTHSTPLPASITEMPAPLPGHSPRRMLAEISEFWRIFIQAAFNPYHPEQHYMRGPGPACARKFGKAAK
ncbi:hypothetical protein [Afipia clevelandensis]|uniref:Uncharacterized protein n=1 Tax=Afipia clevelandensis ATCC 49720 TaxID=883079 RepID=K8P8B7_9BRAD|nr:hypothetical protein [Afipia clevelandensis]EKS35890.1 hypothetical protein HMPREF9696_02102 [Afipia clevelandensis ATCC 49720]